MRNLSGTFKQAIYNGDRNYNYLAVVTLANNTTLRFTNSQLWEGGFNIDDAVSDDNNFTALGSAIIGSASITINNIQDTYSAYDFTNAEVILSISKTFDNEIETIKMGTYVVDEATYNGSLITLTLLDKMEKFDRQYSSNLTYPNSLYNVVNECCTNCGVQLKTTAFPHSTYSVVAKPPTDGVTYRQVISWAATIAGCFARCDVNGALEFKWFNITALDALQEQSDLDGGSFDLTTPYSSGDAADGGSFNPWSTGTDYDGGEFSNLASTHFITGLFSQNIGVDDVVITGVKIVVEVENPTTHSIEGVEHLFGQSGYIIEIKDNPLITADTVQTVGGWLSSIIVGARFRNVSVVHLNNPAIEAGDIGIVIDRKDNSYPILVTRTTFSASNSQTTVCGAESASRNSATRFSEASRAYAESRKLVNEQRSEIDLALQSLATAVSGNGGMYSTIEAASGGGSIFYIHDKPLLSDSQVVWKLNSQAWAVTTNYQGASTDWTAGLTIDGLFVAQRLAAVGVNADWINTGAITVEDTNHNETFYADCDTGEVRINASSFSLSGQSIQNLISDASQSGIYATCSTAAGSVVKIISIAGFEFYTGVRITVTFTHKHSATTSPKLNINNTGSKSIYAHGTEMTAQYYWTDNATLSFVYDGTNWVLEDASDQLEIFNRLTNNGATQGIFLKNGLLYLNWEYAEGGALSLGKNGNVKGYLKVYNGRNYECGTLDKDGLKINANDAWNEYIQINEAMIKGYVMESGSAVLKSFIDIVANYANDEIYLVFDATNCDGMRLKGNVVVEDASTFSDDATFTDTVNMSGTVNVTGNVTFSNKLTATGLIQLPNVVGYTSSFGSPRMLVLDSADNKTVAYMSSASSSKRYKEIQRETVSEDIEDAYNVKIYQARYKDGYLSKGDQREGIAYPMFVVEQMYEHLPNAVDLNEVGEPETWNDRVLLPVMFQMIKDQKDRIDRQEKEIKELNKRLSRIETLLLEQTGVK